MESAKMAWLWTVVVCTMAIMVASIDIKEIKEELMADETFLKARNDCLSELSMTADDLKINYKSEEIPENILCFLKCLEKKRGHIDEDGTIKWDKVQESRYFALISAEKQEEVKKCVDEIQKIVSCQDLKKMLDCVHKFS